MRLDLKTRRFPKNSEGRVRLSTEQGGLPGLSLKMKCSTSVTKDSKTGRIGRMYPNPNQENIPFAVSLVPVTAACKAYIRA